MPPNGRLESATKSLTCGANSCSGRLRCAHFKATQRCLLFEQDALQLPVALLSMARFYACSGPARCNINSMQMDHSGASCWFLIYTRRAKLARPNRTSSGWSAAGERNNATQEDRVNLKGFLQIRSIRASAAEELPLPSSVLWKQAQVKNRRTNEPLRRHTREKLVGVALGRVSRQLAATWLLRGLSSKNTPDAGTRSP